MCSPHLRVFSRVAEAGSFSAVARELGTTQPAVSRQVAALEEHLGARLIQRTTRSLALTEDGRDTAGPRPPGDGGGGGGGVRRRPPPRHARVAWCGWRRPAPSAGFTLRTAHPAPAGTLPGAFGGFADVGWAWWTWSRKGIDLSFRVADGAGFERLWRARSARPAGSPSLSAGCIAAQWRAEASGGSGPPALHPVSPTPPRLEMWHFEGSDGPVSVPVNGRFRTDSGEALARSGAGWVGLPPRLPTWFFDAGIADQALRTVLTGWEPPPQRHQHRLSQPSQPGAANPGRDRLLRGRVSAGPGDLHLRRSLTPNPYRSGGPPANRIASVNVLAPPKARLSVEVVHDLVCPWCYLGTPAPVADYPAPPRPAGRVWFGVPSC